MSDKPPCDPPSSSSGPKGTENFGSLAEEPVNLALQAPGYLARQLSETFQRSHDAENAALPSSTLVLAGSALSADAASMDRTSARQFAAPAPAPFARLAPDSTGTTDTATEDAEPATEVPSTPVIMIHVEFEQNSGSQHKATIIDSMQLPSNMPPLEFRRTVVQAMGLDLERVRLTYSITGQVGKPTMYAFNTSSQVNDAKQKVLGAIARARSKQKGLLIKNADPAPKIDPKANSEEPDPQTATASTSGVAAKPSTTKSKLKKTAVVQDKAVALTETIEALRSLYWCHQCSAFCYICPRTGKHIRLTHEMTTLWAKQCIQTPDVVTLSRPPNHRLFDRSRGVMPVSSLKAEPGGSAKVPIDVDSDTSPPKPINTPSKHQLKKSAPSSVIIISSDSDSVAGESNPEILDIAEVDSDVELPQPADLVHTLVRSYNPHGRLLTDLLDELDEHFPGHNFIAYAELFTNLEITYVRDLAERDLSWLLALTDMEEPSAMILMGATLSEHMSHSFRAGGSKGKGKSKI